MDFAAVSLVGASYFLVFSQHAPDALTFLSVFFNRPLTLVLIKPFFFPNYAGPEGAAPAQPWAPLPAIVCAYHCLNASELTSYP